MRCPHIASELSQEAFLRLSRSDDLTKIENHKAYLFRIAQNLANDYYRNRREHEIAIDNEEIFEHIASPYSVETTVMAEQQLQLVTEALTKLSPLCQRIF